MDFDKRMAHQIKYIRTKNHLTQAEFAEKLNISDHQVQNLENCRSLPSYDLLKILYDNFGFSFDTIFVENIDEAQAIRNEINVKLSHCKEIKKLKYILKLLDVVWNEDINE